MRLIVADEVLKKMQSVMDMQDLYPPMLFKELVIDDMPTIEAEPVKHGHWIFTNKPNIYGGTSIKCSECGYEGMVAHVEDHHYCWSCGAKMDEKGEES